MRRNVVAVSKPSKALKKGGLIGGSAGNPFTAHRAFRKAHSTMSRDVNKFVLLFRVENLDVSLPKICRIPELHNLF